jgi:hypothetical protein
VNVGVYGNQYKRSLTENECELYYPITPKLAIIITKDKLIKDEILYINDLNVKNYNQKMRELSGGLLFSNNSLTLM